MLTPERPDTVDRQVILLIPFGASSRDIVATNTEPFPQTEQKPEAVTFLEADCRSSQLSRSQPNRKTF